MVVSAPGLARAEEERTRLLPVARSSRPASHSTIITGQPGLGQASPGPRAACSQPLAADCVK